MPNVLSGLKYYRPKYGAVKTEQQLMEIFGDLREIYSRFNSIFQISTGNGEIIQDFKHFLKIAVSENSLVILKGSGDIGGLTVKDASLEYDLSTIHNLTRYWNIYRDGSCHSCHKIGQEFVTQDETESYCTIGVNPMQWNNCPKYDSFLKDSEGRTARRLEALIIEATK